MPDLCGRGYADSTHHACEKPEGHRENSTNVYSDPDGAHYSGGLWWTNRWSKPRVDSISPRTRDVQGDNLRTPVHADGGTS